MFCSLYTEVVQHFSNKIPFLHCFFVFFNGTKVITSPYSVIPYTDSAETGLMCYVHPEKHCYTYSCFPGSGSHLAKSQQHHIVLQCRLVRAYRFKTMTTPIAYQRWDNSDPHYTSSMYTENTVFQCLCTRSL